MHFYDQSEGGTRNGLLEPLGAWMVLAPVICGGLLLLWGLYGGYMRIISGLYVGYIGIRCPLYGD